MKSWHVLSCCASDSRCLTLPPSPWVPQLWSPSCLVQQWVTCSRCLCWQLIHNGNVPGSRKLKTKLLMSVCLRKRSWFYDEYKLKVPEEKALVQEANMLPSVAQCHMLIACSIDRCWVQWSKWALSTAPSSPGSRANGNHLPAALTCSQVRVLYLGLLCELLSDKLSLQRSWCCVSLPGRLAWPLANFLQSLKPRTPSVTYNLNHPFSCWWKDTGIKDA